MRIPNNWKPRWYQVPLWKYLWNGGKRAIEIGHRRWGKDDICLHWAAVSSQLHPATYWHMLPEAAQARKAVWEAVNPHTGKRRIDEAFPQEIRTATRENEMLIKLLGGSTWQVVGSDNFNSLVGSPPYGVVFSEWALANPEAWAYIRPILRENGGWALFITTPRGDNHAKSMYDSAVGRPTWFAELSPVTKTKILSQTELDEELQEYIDDWGVSQGKSLYEQEWMCLLPGSYIWTSKGQKKIETMNAGDTVLTHAGRWRQVTNLLQHDHTGELVKISSSGNCNPLVCTPNHPLQLCEPKTQKYRWEMAGDVRVGDYVVMPRIKIPSASIITRDTAELIGWFITEGFTDKNRVQFSIGASETHFANHIADIASRYGNASITENGRGALIVRVNSCWLADFLSASCGVGAANKRIPWDLIAGHEKIIYETLIDGDGCRGNYSGSSEVFSTISYGLALDVQMLAHMIGKRARVNMRPAAKQTNVIEGRKVNVSDSYSVWVANIKKDAKYYGEHTKPKVLPQKHGVASLVTNVSRCEYRGPVYNFSVQHDESYVANGVVVHNCSFKAAIVGAYYAEELQLIEERGQITEVPWIEGIPVDTWWDLGYDDSTSIWFTQTVGREIHIIGYYENNNQGLLHYGKELRRRQVELNWVYGVHKGPHDTMKHELGTGKDLKEQASCLRDPITDEDFSFVFSAANRIESQQQGIQAVRSILPFCWFDKSNCVSTTRERKVGIPSLENYRNEWDEKKKTFVNRPLHDWSSHGAKAFETMAISHQFGTRKTDWVSAVAGG